MAFASSCSINRYYDPTTDSFISVDPAVQQTNEAYVYVNDNPLNTMDPLGLAGNMCDNTNLKKQNKCIAAEKAAQAAADKSCPSGYFTDTRKCDPGLAKNDSCSYSSCAPAWPSIVINGVAGAIACGTGFGTVICAIGGAVIGISSVASDAENGCSVGKTTTDTGLGIAGTVFGVITNIGGSALDGAPLWMKAIYTATTGAPSAGVTALQSRSGSQC
jgi:uncharacterized protein RhaS with RHS repeats